MFTDNNRNLKIPVLNVIIILCVYLHVGFPCDSVVKNFPTSTGETGSEDPLEKEMATHSSILVWRIPWTEESGRLQSTGSQRVGHD